MKKNLVVLALLALALGALGATVATAAPPEPKSPIVWTGNGTSNGFCSDVSTDTDLAPGTQSWLFVLTSPSSSSWELSGHFADDGAFGPVAGTQQGQGAIHFVVTSSAGDQLLDAQATNGMTNSVLTVSHCTVNETAPTTAPTTAPGPQVSPAVVAVSPAEAVRATPGFTG